MHSTTDDTIDDTTEVRKDPIPFDIFAITSFICTGFYVFLFSILIKQESFPLTSFPNRIIGIAILEGVDTVARTQLYIYALIFTGILALICLIVLERTMDRIIPTIHYEKERFFLALISIFGTANLILGILTKNSVFLFIIYLTICLLCCIITLIGAKKYAEIKQPQHFKVFEDSAFLNTSMHSTTEVTTEVRKDSIPFDIFAIISFICTGFYVFLFSILIKQEFFPLTSFPNRIIGIAILDGVDTVARTQLYLYALIFTGILALICLIVLERTMDRIIPTIHYEKERFFLALISIFGTANLILGILTKNSVFLFNIYLIICLLCCIITLIGAKKYAEIKQPQHFKMFEDSAFLISLFLIPVPCLFAIQVLEGDAFAFSLISFVTYYLIYSLLLLALIVLSPARFPWISDSTFRGVVTTSLTPLYFYPLSIPLTNELQYTLSQWFSIDPRILSFGVLFCLGLICILLFWIRARRNSLVFNPQSTLDNFSFPALLAALSIYANYVSGGSFQTVTIGNVFEHGLTSTLVQQFFDFGKIPFINIVSPHGFMDLYYEIFYSIVNGYQPIDGFLWKWITPILIVLAGYFFFKEFIEGLPAFLLIVLLPVYGILLFSSFFILFAGICFVRFWKDPQLKNYILLLIAILFCFIWRIECGVASVLAVVLIAAVLYFKILKKSPVKIWNDYSGYIYATIGISGICVGIYIALCFITHESPITAIQSVINSYIVMNPNSSYPTFFPTYNTQVVLQYAIFPLFGLGVVIIFIWNALTRKCNVTAQFILVAFIAIATLFLSQRGIQRHSLMEGNLVWLFYSFLLIACSFPLLWYRSKKLLSIILLILILVAGSFIAQYPLIPIQKDLTNNYFEFKIWEQHEPRIVLQDSDIKEVANLSDFLGTTLRPNETFFEMSNFLMPYPLLRIEYVPVSESIFAQPGEWFQNDAILRLTHNKDRIPIVVTGGAQIDGVTNEMRTYRIAEYVYTNYQPIGHIDNYEIWLRNDLNTSHVVPSSNQSYMIPFNAKNFMSHDIQTKNQEGGIVLHSGSNDPHAWNFILNGSPTIQSDSINTGFHLVYTSDTSGLLQVFYSVSSTPFSEEHSIVVTVKNANGDQDLNVILPENIRYITNIRMDPPDNSNLTLKRAYLYPQNTSLVPDKDIYRDFNLKKLPYIWGTFDTTDPVSRQPVQNVLFDGEIPVDFGNPAVFTNISPDLDKTSGNYLLIKLRSPRSGEIQMEYGNADDNVGKPAIMKFETVPSDKEQNYLIRISSQWDWYSKPTTYIRLSSTVPITLYDCKILKGD